MSDRRRPLAFSGSFLDASGVEIPVDMHLSFDGVNNASLHGFGNLFDANHGGSFGMLTHGLLEGHSKDGTVVRAETAMVERMTMHGLAGALKLSMWAPRLTVASIELAPGQRTPGELSVDWTLTGSPFLDELLPAWFNTEGERLGALEVDPRTRIRKRPPSLGLFDVDGLRVGAARREVVVSGPENPLGYRQRSTEFRPLLYTRLVSADLSTWEMHAHIHNVQSLMESALRALSFFAGHTVAWLTREESLRVEDPDGKKGTAHSSTTFALGELPARSMDRGVHYRTLAPVVARNMDSIVAKYLRGESHLDSAISSYLRSSKLAIVAEFIFLSTALETLKDLYVQDGAVTTLVDKSVFAPVARDIRAALDHGLQTHELEARVLQQLRSKIGGLNRQSLTDLVLALCRDWGVELADLGGSDTVRAIVRYRNSLMHSSGRASLDSHRAYRTTRQLKALVERIIANRLAQDVPDGGAVQDVTVS